MLEAIFSVFLIAILGSLTVPVTMLGLAHIGYFEPIEFSLFGRDWRFAPKNKIAMTSANVTSGMFPRTTLASAMPVVLTVIAHLQIIEPPVARVGGVAISVVTQSNAIVRIRNVEDAEA